MSDPTSYNNATSVSVYDSLGNSHVLQTFYVNAGNGSWKVYAAADDAPLTGTSSDGYIGTLSFDTSGNLTSPAAPLSAAIPASGGAAPFTVQVDYTGTTQYGSAFTVNALSQDGYAAGHLTGFTTGDNGIITGRYSNGKSSTLGQVVLANFTNVNGLQPLGNNVWAETASSGPPLVSTPGSGTFGKLQASAVEDSNVDLTAELVNMITAQRVYQANAQTVKTQDQVMQTLVNLR
jgi:flagellar hook protein FlgE